MRALGARRHERGPGRARRRRQRLAATARSTTLLRRAPRRARRAPRPATSATPAPRTSGPRRRRRPIVAVLNPDTELEPGAAGALLARFDGGAARSAPCGPRIRNLDGTDYPSARIVPDDRRRGRSRAPRPVVADEPVHGPVPAARRRSRRSARLVDWVSGAAIWLRRAALDEVGGWDERYFMYLEDTDLCWRLRHAGWDVAYEPSGVVDARAGREHVPPAVPHARRAPPVGVPLLEGPLHRRPGAAPAVRGRLLHAAGRDGDGGAHVPGRARVTTRFRNVNATSAA